jgi:type IV secretion system protein VirD4
MKHGLYRLPPPAGYVGGFQWRVLALFLLLLLLGNWAGTQYIAHRFRYQRALGTPLLEVGKVRIYQPLAWLVWGLKYQMRFAPDPRLTRPITEGFVIVVVAGVLSVWVVGWYQQRRVKRAMKGTEDLHGSARWADRRDIKASGLLGSPEGVYVGAWRDGDQLRYLKHNGPDHALAFAPTRSGKGVGLVLPTLLGSWQQSAVIYDIKGENWAKTAGWRSTLGPVFRFAPADAECSSRFNPLAEIRLGTQREVADTQNIAKMLVHDGVNAHEPYWSDTAELLLEGIILHVCYVAAKQGRVACLGDVHDLLTEPGKDFRKTLKEMLAYPHMPDGSVHPTIAAKAQDMLSKEDRNFDGVHSTAKTALKLYSDPVVAQVTSASDFRINDLVSHGRPVSLYIIVPASDKKRLRPLTRLMFTLIVNHLTERMEYDGVEQRKNKHRLLFLIDEFPSLRRMDVFADALSYMAGYGLKAYLITQDIRQIEDSYGAKESIVSNCNVRCAFAPNTYETAKLLSEMTGEQTVVRENYSFSGKRFDPVMKNVSASLDHVRRPLLTPDEVSRLRAATKTGEGANERITEPGQMLIFVAGQRPILGTQMLYFLDPVLSERAKLVPPVWLCAIEDGQEVRQRPVNRTPHVVSRIEVAPEDEAPAQMALSLPRRKDEELDGWI